MAGLDLIMYKDGLKEGLKEGIQQGIEQGMEQGMQQGMRQGKTELMISMIRDKVISINDAAKRLGITESELLKLM